MAALQPVNPKPLYPRDLGYQFRGYEFDADAVPTFLYEIDEVKVSDRSAAEVVDGKPVLKRRLQFASDKARTMLVRLAAGDVAALEGKRFRAGKVELMIASGEPVLRDAEVGKELIVRLALPAGKSELAVEYLINE